MERALRKIIFWIHLPVGILAGLIVLIMSVTGVILTYEKQTVAWTDRGYQSAAKPGATPSLEAILNAAQARGGAAPTAVTVKADPAAPALLAMGRESVYVDAYTGELLGKPSPEGRAFFRAVTDWHRWLATAGDNRATGKAITGAANLGFLFLVVSGAYLWLPRVFGAKQFRAITWFRGGLSGKARDFNWHNVIGIWCVVPLFLIVISGAVMSYPWANALVYQLAGTPLPAPAPARAPEKQPEPVVFAGADAAWQKASGQVADWTTITFRVPTSNGAPWSFTIDAGTAGQPQKRGTLTVNRETGTPVKWETFADLEAGRQWRSWVRFVHTGEYYGVAGQTVAGLASLGGAFLVWTGIALSLRRFTAWRERRSKPALVQQMAARQPVV
jgi:uncharacterized iron-regulated membrane protein